MRQFAWRPAPAAALLLGFASGAAAQFRVETRAVLVDVSVTAAGGPVRGLGRENFELRVGGEPKAFRLLDPESLALAVLFAMDGSASTAGDRRRRLADGARRFASALTAGDACAVVSFSTEARWVREFSACGPEIGDRLLQTRSGGATALWDGMVLSLAALHQGSGRPVLLVFTDGEDNLSWTRADHLREAVRGSDALLYAIVAPAPRVARNLRPDDRGPRLLRELTGITGGRVVTIRSDEDLGGAFEAVLADLRVRYVLAFTPDPGREGFVPIEVKVRSPQVRIRVRARAGYTARP